MESWHEQWEQTKTLWTLTSREKGKLRHKSWVLKSGPTKNRQFAQDHKHRGELSNYLHEPPVQRSLQTSWKKDLIFWLNSIFINISFVSCAIFTHTSTDRETYTCIVDRVAAMPHFSISTFMLSLEGPSIPSAHLFHQKGKRFSQLFQGSLDSSPYKQAVLHVLNPRIQQKDASWLLKCQPNRDYAQLSCLESECCAALGDISKLWWPKNSG